MTKEKKRFRIKGDGDLFVIVCWGVLMAALSLSRRDFLIDGLRHISPILEAARPALGEIHWLLFPGFLYMWIRPWVTGGVIHGIEGALLLFQVFSLVSGFFYLWFLRVWLIAVQTPMRARAAALALAGATAPLVILSSNVAELPFAAMIAVGGLAFAAVHGNKKRSVIVASSLIALGALVYQGVILAVFFLPCVLRPKTLLKRENLVSLVILFSLVPACWLLFLVGERGLTAGRAFRALLTGFDNTLWAASPERETLSSHLAAIFAGPPLGILPLPDFRGMGTVFHQVLDPTTAAAGMFSLAVLAAGLGILALFLGDVLRRRDWCLLAALAGILILPLLLRYRQYPYLKFYIFLPLFLGLAAARMNAKVVAVLAVFVLAWNGGLEISKVMAGRHLYAELMPLYERAGTQGCWVTEGHEAPMGYRWKGRTCGMRQILGERRGGDLETFLEDRNNELYRCFKRCFCADGPILTQDMTWEHAREITALAEHFRFRRFDFRDILWTPERGSRLLETVHPPVVAFDAAAREHICKRITRD